MLLEQRLPYHRTTEVSMTFIESIKICFFKYADFSGRASRSEYWWFFLFIVLIVSAAGCISEKLLKLVAVATVLPLYAVGARRLHDTNRSCWLLCLYFIPLFGMIAIKYFLVQPPEEPNRFGDPQD